MSVVLTPSTVVAPLWPSTDTTSPSTTVPVFADGLFLSFQLASEPNTPPDAVTCVAFHPVDETCFVFGTQSGRAYGVSLQENKLFLLAHLGPDALRCVIFCPGYLTSPIAVFVQRANHLVFVDWQHGTVCQKVEASAHTRPIVQLVTGLTTESLFCTVSADTIACWEPVEVKEKEVLRRDGATDRKTSVAMGVSSLQPQQPPLSPASMLSEVMQNALTSGSATASAGNRDTVNANSAPVYACTGVAQPTAPTLCKETHNGDSMRVLPEHISSPASSRFLGLHIVGVSTLLSVESNGILSLWTRLAASEVPASPAEGFMIRETTPSPPAELSDCDRVLTQRLRLQMSAAAPATLRVQCSVLCGGLVALGADAETRSKRRDTFAIEPVVAFVDAETLKGTAVVRLPTARTNAFVRPSAHSPSHAAQAVTAAVTVVQVRAVQSDLVACLLSTGVVHVLLSSTYHLAFSLTPPMTEFDTLSRRFVPQSHWSFTPSGPSFGALCREHVLALLHLPTARRGATDVASPAPSFGGKKDALVNTRDPRQKEVKNTGGLASHVDPRTSVKRLSPTQLLLPLPPTPSSTSSIAVPFLKHRASVKGPTVAAPTTATAVTPAAGTHSSPCGEVDGDPIDVEASLKALSESRRMLTIVPKKVFPRTWVDVNLADMQRNAREPSPSKNISRSSSPAASGQDAASTPAPCVVWSEAKFCDTLTPTSCRYNVKQLQAHLGKYGVFPHTYRPLIWRFLAGLPTKATTAAQFAALARRPLHVAVEGLMKPFNLPPSPTRRAMEEALSCLCWATPVLTLASYAPVLVYPLTVLHGDDEDVQSVVELVLVYFANWGKEFFTCHPHGPTALLAVLEREAWRQDTELCRHLNAVGAAVDVWGWELLLSFYTDVLTGPEWLQLMDHALLASPAWLFAFHLSLLRVRLRGPLLRAVSADEVREVLGVARHSNPSPVVADTFPSLKKVLEAAYALYAEWVGGSGDGSDRVPELASYVTAATFSNRFDYPSHFLHDPVILSEKMRELALVQQSREDNTKAAERLVALRKEAAALAAKEAAFLQQQRARMAAKQDASAAAWQTQVTLERVRQEQEAEEQQLRWAMVQERTCSAEALSTLQAEMNTVEAQLRHSMVDQHMEQLKWGLAAHLTDAELRRLQQEAEEEVERAVSRIQDSAEANAQELLRRKAEPVFVMQTSSEDDLSAAVPEEDSEDTDTITASLKAHTLQESHHESGRDVEDRHSEREPDLSQEDMPEDEAKMHVPAAGPTLADMAGAAPNKYSATYAPLTTPREDRLHRRLHRARPPLHHSARHASTDDTSANVQRHADPTQKTFLELRDRVLRRLQPGRKDSVTTGSSSSSTSYPTAITSNTTSTAPTTTSTSTTTTTTAATTATTTTSTDTRTSAAPSYENTSPSSSAFRNSSSRTGATRTTTGTTTTQTTTAGPSTTSSFPSSSAAKTMSTSTASSTAGHRLFDNYDTRHRHQSRVAAAKGAMQRPHALDVTAPPHERLHALGSSTSRSGTATATGTSPTPTTTSYATPSSWSYNDDSPSQSGKGAMRTSRQSSYGRPSSTSFSYTTTP